MRLGDLIGFADLAKKLQEAPHIDIELTRLESGVDEEILKAMLDPWYQRLTLKGFQVLKYYELTIDGIQIMMNYEANKEQEDPDFDVGDVNVFKVGSDIHLYELFYSVQEKAIFSKLDAWAMSQREYPNVRFKYDLFNERPSCRIAKPAAYPNKADDDIDLMKVLPERILLQDWM